MATAHRSLSLHERFSLARRNAGCPPIIVIATSYPSSAAPTEAFLRHRITELQDHFPLLYACIDGRTTTAPRTVIRGKPWDANDVLSIGTHDLGTLDEGSRELERILLKEGESMCAQDFEDRPLWHVAVHTRGQKDHVIISLAADHLIMDGRGLQLLNDALLAKDISSLPYEKLEDIPHLEDTVSLKPSLLYALPSIWRHLVLPVCPLFIRRLFSPAAPWPANLIHHPPLECSPAFSLLSIPADQISALKTMAKSYDVATLHPVLKSIYGLVIWSKYRYTLSPFRLIAESPRSERDPTLGHAYCTSNYVSSCPLDINFAPGEDFWTVAKKLREDMISPTNIARGRMNVGMLSYIPNDKSGSCDPLRPTTWEEFYLEGASSEKPYSGTLEVSNLGYCKLPVGADDCAWMQLASGLSSAFFNAVIGHENGVRLGTVWKDGAAVTGEEVKDIERRFKVALERLLNGRKLVDDLVEL